MPAVLGHFHISSANVFWTLRLPHTWLPLKNPQVSGTIHANTPFAHYLSRFFKACSGAHPFLWKCIFFHMQIKVIFVRVVMHQASLVSRTLVIVQLVNCPFFPFTYFQFCPGVHPQQNEKNSVVKTGITWLIDRIQVKYLSMKRWKILKIGGKISSMDVKEEGLFKKGPLWTKFTRVFRIWSTDVRVDILLFCGILTLKTEIIFYPAQPCSNDFLLHFADLQSFSVSAGKESLELLALYKQTNPGQRFTEHNLS